MKGGELEVNKIKTFPVVEKGGENESPVLKHRAFSHARRHQSGAPAGWPGTQAPKGPALRRSASSKPPRRPWRGQGSPGPIQALGEPQDVDKRQPRRGADGAEHTAAAPGGPHQGPQGARAGRRAADRQGGGPRAPPEAGRPRRGEPDRAPPGGSPARGEGAGGPHSRGGGAEPPPGPRRGPVPYLILGQYSVSREVD